MKKKLRNKGFTLVEIMVSMLILSALALALVMIYRTGLTEYNHASGRITLQLKSRLVLDKLLFFLSSAARPNGDPSGDPVPFPPATGSVERELTFISGPNLLIDGTNPASADPVTFRNNLATNQHRYRVRFQPAFLTDPSRELVIQDMGTNGATVTGAPKVIGNNLLDVTFQRVQPSAIQVQISCSNWNATSQRYVDGESMHRATSQGGFNAQGQAVGASNRYDLDSAIQLPIYSL